MLTLNDLNNLEYDGFNAALFNVVEKNPFIIATLWKYRPFRHFDDLMDRLVTIIQSLPLDTQEGLLR